MDELLVLIQAAYLVELLFNELLDSLDIVVGYRLYILYPLGIGFGETAIDGTKALSLDREVGQLGQRTFAQSDEILHLYAHTILYQSKLGKIKC